MSNEDIHKPEDDGFDDICKLLSNTETSTIPSVLHESDQRHSIGKVTTERRLKFKSGKVICEPPKYMGEAYSRVEAYLEEKKISKLFNFLIGHLLVEEPPDPIRYLEQLLKECMLYRSGVREPPLLFKTRHIRSMFRSLGPDDCDTISLDKYKIGMITLGICPCNLNSFECMPERVDWHTFEKEARQYLDEALDDMIGKKKNGAP